MTTIPGLRSAIVVGLVVLTGCGLSPISSQRPIDTLPPIEPAATTPARVVRDAVDSNSTAGGWINDCIGYVQHGAFVGEPKLWALWNAAGQDAETIRAVCEQLPGPDFAALYDVSLTTRSD